MKTADVYITRAQVDLTVELRFANGLSAEFYEANEERVREALRLLAAPRLFAQPHLLLASHYNASLIPCKGIDLIVVRIHARTPLQFPLNLPQGQFDLVEYPGDGSDSESAENEDQIGYEHGRSLRRNSRLEIHTLGGWAVTLKAIATIRGNVQDERQLFAHLPDVPSIPFRLVAGGFGLVNTANILRASIWPQPEALPVTALPLTLRRWNPARINGPANFAQWVHS